MSDVKTTPRWDIECFCHWCGSRFIRMEIDRVQAFVCPTEACRERQLAWKRVDLGGNLFHLPTPKQVELYESVKSQKFGAICLGGERGSAKSIGVRNLIYNCCLDPKLPEFSALLFRKELGELELNQWRFFLREAPRLGAEGNAKKITFPTGAELRPAHNNSPGDYRKYIGGDLDLIVIEQAEEFTQKPVAEIGAATGRSTRYGSYWRGLLALTENPGGPLSAWINEIFVHKSLDKTLYPNYKPENYHFIEHRLSDNPWVDPRYEQNLAILSPMRREMMRHGRRDIFEGQFFKSFLKETHVTADPGERGVKWMASLHFGFNQMGHALLWNILPTQHVYIRACYRFEQMNEDALVRELNAWAQSLGLHRMPLTYAQPEMFTKPDVKGERVVGQSIAETLQAYDLPVIEADADELNGWKRVHALLRNDPDGTPWLRLHPSCEDLINGLSNAMSAEHDADLIDADSPMLSALKALRYGAMARPVPPNMRVKPVYKAGSAGWYIQRAMREPVSA